MELSEGAPSVFDYSSIPKICGNCGELCLRFAREAEKHIGELPDGVTARVMSTYANSGSGIRHEGERAVIEFACQVGGCEYTYESAGDQVGGVVEEPQMHSNQLDGGCIQP